ncbi:hypothetical protein BDFB_001792 [Asbolus verrucosus]|uniref:Uncharacterized protein n=1 Tax=Asbolus verrucosus TaxID=1661398 RepID=A0A482VIG8_ASBVE|nr:hypothetical protein BDFB_001792 [Asbolus verrucosus]
MKPNLYKDMNKNEVLIEQKLEEPSTDNSYSSLPAGTQTDQDQGTQTEPQYLRPPLRKVRSDNDASEGSDGELTIIRERARRRNVRRSHLRKIKTPIQEESEIEIVEKPVKLKSSAKPRLSIRHTRTSELRQKKASSRRSKSSRSNIHKEVLREISASLDQTDNSNSGEEDEYEEKQQRNVKYFSEDSLEDISPRSEKTTDSSKQRYHSESDLRIVSPPLQESIKSQSHTDLTNVKEETKNKQKKKKHIKRTSRYMEWYNKNSKNPPTKPVEDSSTSKKSKSTDNADAREDTIVKETVKKISNRLTQDTESSSRKKVDPKKPAVGPEHPLVQHSERRFEAQYPTARKPEEDTDSGIALTRLPIAQKKSVFTIAYDDMHTSQLRPESRSPPL